MVGKKTGPFAMYHCPADTEYIPKPRPWRNNRRDILYKKTYWNVQKIFHCHNLDKWFGLVALGIYLSNTVNMCRYLTTHVDPPSIVYTHPHPVIQLDPSNIVDTRLD